MPGPLPSRNQKGNPLASSRTPGPVGIAIRDLGELRAHGRRALTLAGAVDPGACGDVSNGAASGEAGPQPQVATWVALDLGDGSSDDAANSGASRLVRIASAGETEAGCQRVPVDRRDDAERIAALLAGHHLLAPQLRRFRGRVGPPPVDWTVDQLVSGQLKVLWRFRQPLVVGTTPHAAPNVAPPPPRAAWTPPAPAATPVDSTFPPDLDAAAIASVLADAARDGVPFCEECMKAAQARSDAGAGAS
jgi:hypothetical protein